MMRSEDVEHVVECLEDALDILSGWSKVHSNQLKIEAVERLLNNLLVDIRTRMKDELD